MDVYDYAERLLEKMSNEPLTIDKITIEKNENIFEYASKLLQDYQLFPDYERFKLSDNKKSKELATKHRLKGNELFRDRKYFSALCAYNKSLCFAVTNSEDVGLAFANRSAVYLEIEEFELCKENINFAKEFGYPSSKSEKLERREKNCYGKIVEKSRDLKLLQLTHKSNPKYPFVADCLKIQNNSEFGRHIVTDKALNIGDVVAIDHPFCAILSTKHNVRRCANCLGSFKLNLLPCPKCTSGKKMSRNGMKFY